MAVPPEVERRVEELRATIEHHNRAYHELDAPEIPDADYDALVAGAARARGAVPRADHARLAHPAGRRCPADGAVRAGHPPQPLLSLDNAFDVDELDAWGHAGRARHRRRRDRLRLRTEDRRVRASASPTSTAASRRPRPGATGGSARTSPPTSPRSRPCPTAFGVKNAPALVEVRGEVYMPLGAFERLNQRQLEAEARTFVNPRNAAAGSVRQKDPGVTAGRELSLWTYQLGATDGTPQVPQPPRDPRVAGRRRAAGQSGDPRASTPSTTSYARCEELLRNRHGARLRDRRRRRQGRRPRPARRARLARHGRRAGPSPTSSRPRNARPACSRSGSPSVARAGPRPFAVLEPVFVGGVTVEQGDAAQPGSGPSQGRSSRRHRRGPARRRRHPRGRRAGARRAPQGPEAVGVPDGVPGVRRAAACGSRPRPTRSASTSPARRRTAGAILHFASRGAMDIEGLGEQRIQEFASLVAARRRPASTTSTGTRSPPSRATARCRCATSGPPSRPPSRARSTSSSWG